MLLKKILSILLMLSLVFSFTACGRQDNEDENDSGTSKAKSSKSGKTISDVFKTDDSGESGDTGESQGNDQEKDSGISKDSKDSVVFCSDDGTFSFEYPVSWSALDAEGVEHEFVTDSEGNSMILMMEDVASSYNLDLQGYADLNVENLKQGIDVNNLSVEDATVGADSYDAKIVSYDFTDNGKNYSQKCIILLEGEKGYIITYTNVSNNIDKEFERTIIPVLDTVNIRTSGSSDSVSNGSNDSESSDSDDSANKGNDESSGATDSDAEQLLLGKWTRITEINGEGLFFRSDGTYQQISISYYEMFRTWWFNYYSGNYKVEGDTITFYNSKMTTVKKEGIVQYSIGDYDMVEELEWPHEEDEPIDDSTYTFEVKDSNTILFGDDKLEFTRSE